HLALLPLHAVVDDDEGSDQLVWSYAPNAQVLRAAYEAARARTVERPRLLHVGAPGTGSDMLSFTNQVPSALDRHAGVVTSLRAEAGQRQAVLTAGDQDVYHFVCHAVADRSDPLDSHLSLADGQLTIRDLLGRRLSARLAVLAACETGVPYAELPDESVSLPAALLQAGIPGIVGTLWPVEELPTLLLTTRFYELWLGHRLAPAEALHHARRWLRSGTVADFDRYMREQVGGQARWPYRGTTGRARKHRIFAHPDCWAAFTYTGV
ncbi:MAG TPA: CHAT domain-containing protein, partial [Micromonospora sp.]